MKQFKTWAKVQLVSFRASSGMRYLRGRHRCCFRVVLRSACQLDGFVWFHTWMDGNHPTAVVCIYRYIFFNVILHVLPFVFIFLISQRIPVLGMYTFLFGFFRRQLCACCYIVCIASISLRITIMSKAVVTSAHSSCFPLMFFSSEWYETRYRENC